MSDKKEGAFKKWQKCFRGSEIERICIRINIDKGHRRCPKQRLLSNVILHLFTFQTPIIYNYI